MLDRKIAPQIQKITEIPFPSPTVKKLSNGIPIHGFNIGSQEVVQIELIVKAGQKHGDKPLEVSTMASMVGEASSKYKTGEIIELIDYYGAFFESSCDGDKTYFALFTLTKHLKTVLPIFAEAILNPTFPERETGIYLKNSQQNFLTQREKTDYICRKNFNRLLFQVHPYGRTLAIEDYDKVTSESLHSFHKQHLVAPNCELFVSGNYNEELYDLLENYFSSIPNKKSEIIKFQKVITNQGGQHFFEKEDAIQSGIRIGKTLDVEFGSIDFYNLKILNTLFGGYFGSRLMKNIREDKGYTYGIYSYLSSYLNGAYFCIATDVGVQYKDLTLNEISKEINRLKTELVSEDELQMVKNYLKGKIMKGVDGSLNFANILKGNLSLGLNENRINEQLQAIEEISAERLLILANKYLDFENMYKVAVG